MPGRADRGVGDATAATSLHSGDAQRTSATPHSGIYPVSPARPPQFDEIARNYTPLIVRRLRQMRIAESDLDDVKQQVLLSIHRSLPAFRGESALPTWIYKICWHRAQDHFCALQRLRKVQAAVSRSQEPPLVDVHQVRSDAQESARLLYAALDTLPPLQREVLVLSDIEGLEVNEIAELLGCPRDTVYSRRREAREKLAALDRSLAQRRNPR